MSGGSRQAALCLSAHADYTAEHERNEPLLLPSCGPQDYLQSSEIKTFPALLLSAKSSSRTATLCKGAQPWDPPVGASQGTGSRTAVSARAVPGLALSRGGEIISSGRLPHFWSLSALHGNAASYVDAPTSPSLSLCVAEPAPKTWEGVGQVPQ